MDQEEIEVLIIEDNPTDAELMERSLKASNLACRLFILEDGEMALDYIFCRGSYNDRNINNLPAVIFLDLKLPKLSGLEVLKEIKSNERTKCIPVIIVSSSQEDADITRAYSLGANSYIVKPVNFSKFNKIINQLGIYWLIINENSR